MNLQSILFENEAVEDAAAPAAPEPAVAAEPTPLAAAPALEEPAGEPDDGELSPEEAEAQLRDLIYDEAQALLEARLAGGYPQGVDPGIQYEEPYAPPPVGGFDWASLDPYSDDFGARLGEGLQLTIAQGVAAAVQQGLAPIADVFTSAEQARRDQVGEENAQSMIDDAIAAGPDLLDSSKARVWADAERLMPAAIQRYGNTPRAAEAAIYQAVSDLRALEAEAAGRANTMQQNHLGTLAGAPASPGAAAAAAAGVTPGVPLQPLSAQNLAAKYGLRGGRSAA